MRMVVVTAHDCHWASPLSLRIPPWACPVPKDTVNWRDIEKALALLWEYIGFLEGRQLLISTNHIPLTFVTKSGSSKFYTREIRHLSYVAEFTTDIRPVQDLDNSTAAALSRGTASLSSGASSANLDSAQNQDAEIRDLPNIPDHWFSVKFSFLRAPFPSFATLQQALPAFWSPLRFIVQFSTPSNVFLKRNLRHAVSPYATLRMAWYQQRHVILGPYTPGVPTVGNTAVTTSPFGLVSPRSARFHKLRIDILISWSPPAGYCYLLMSIDRFTRWPEAFRLPDGTNDPISRIFVAGWVSGYGAPSTVTTDRGPQFEYSLFMNIQAFLGSSRILVAAYPPIANSMI
ncbi:uncharacterized protein LOC144119739 [Amblyomma americanum]